MALPRAAAPGSGDRVLLVAPHPDDEAIALGGLLHEAGRSGAEVRIAFLTDGDGFPACAPLRGWLPDRSAMRALGRLRREEAVRSAAHLGIPPERLTFLGLPDRGLAPLWIRCWGSSTPYTSPYTGSTIWGATVLAQVEELLRTARPTHLYFPDALDDHPDHWAAYCFVRAALARLEPSAAPCWRTYLVHRGVWPRPLGDFPTRSLTPPPELAFLRLKWESFPLTGPALAAKRAAVLAHRSQQRLAGRFLRSFLRADELLIAPRDRLACGDEAPEPVRDRPGRALLPGADIRSLQVDRHAAGSIVRVRLRGAVVPGLRYRLYVKPLSGAIGEMETRQVAMQPRDGELKGVLPEEADAAGGAVLLGAEVWLGPVLLDRTAWHLWRW
ncbi:MAG: PIG-L deacetylase family protein [Armatimonadota bacterium]